MDTETQAIIALIKSCGYRVFMHGPDQEWCHYTDGTKIGYAQWSQRTCVTSVHKPSRSVGTGFNIADAITPDTLKDALNCIAPGWATASDCANVWKYRDWDEFHQADAWNRGFYEV